MQANEQQTSKVSVGADCNGGVDNVRVTTTLMKSVSLFLTSAWRVSVNEKRSSSVKTTKQELRRPRKKKMPESGNPRNSAYIIKVIESLKKKTKFSRSDEISIFFSIIIIFIIDSRPRINILKNNMIKDNAIKNITLFYKFQT